MHQKIIHNQQMPGMFLLAQVTQTFPGLTSLSTNEVPVFSAVQTALPRLGAFSHWDGSYNSIGHSLWLGVLSGQNLWVEWMEEILWHLGW